MSDITLILAVAIFVAGAVLCAQILAQRPIVYQEKKFRYARGHRYATVSHKDVIVTAVTATRVHGYIINAGFTVHPRTPCQWDHAGRAFTKNRSLDLQEEI